jgi:hypothetical protein
MKYVRTFESEDSLLGDLEKLGYEPFVGFMYWAGTPQNQFGFIVVGATEQKCLEQLKKHIYQYLELPSYGTGGFARASSGGVGMYNKESIGSFLEMLFEQGYIRDAGYYQLKAKKNVALLEVFTEPYLLNPKWIWDKAKEYFSDAEEVFSKEKPDSKIYYFY